MASARPTLGGLCLLVMEKLTGGTLWERFTGHGMTPQSACGVLIATCAGLDHAHQHGVLHRDIKPENLLFSHDGILKVVDFGIAKVLSGEQALATRAGDVLGTPAYMAPEQALGTEVGPGTDVYACGVMLYELFTGRLPFSEEGGPLVIVYRHVHEQPTPILEVSPRTPPALAEVVVVLLLVVSYAESYLRQLRTGRRKVTGPVALAVAGGGFGVGLVGVAWLLTGQQPTTQLVALSAAAGAVAGLAAAMAAIRARRRRRVLVRLQ